MSINDFARLRFQLLPLGMPNGKGTPHGGWVNFAICLKQNIAVVLLTNQKDYEHFISRMVFLVRDLRIGFRILGPRQRPSFVETTEGRQCGDLRFAPRICAALRGAVLAKYLQLKG